MYKCYGFIHHHGCSLKTCLSYAVLRFNFRSTVRELSEFKVEKEKQNERVGERRKVNFEVVSLTSFPLK